MTSRAGQPTRRASIVRLVALLDGRRVGTVHQDANGRFRFLYEDEWREHPDAYPLSVSMPLTAREHSHETINPWLWGLLPDNDRTLDQYARRYGVSAANPVAILAHIGADCAGAVQFASPDDADPLLGSTSTLAVEWLDERRIAADLRAVRDHGIPGGDARTSGRFSLAGAQPKIALLEDNGRWGIPRGRTPTNRILKPPSPDFKGFAENEHFCLELAAALGLGAVRSRVMRFENETAIVIDRFDRQKRKQTYHRIHQEDACQALAVMPTRKYESEGGPGVRDLVLLIREYSQEPLEDVDRFLAAMALNWILAATDGHAKNYALLHGPRGSTRLAPFYDIASILPYAEPALHRVKLAMRIGSEYLVRRIARRHWESVAKTAGIPSVKLLDQVERVARDVGATVDDVRRRAIQPGLDPELIDMLAARVRKRANSCLASLAR